MVVRGKMSGNTKSRNDGEHILWQLAARILQLLILFSTVLNLLLLTGPFFMLQVYDRVIPARSQETLLALLLLVAGLYVVLGGLDFVRGRLLHRAAMRWADWVETALATEAPTKGHLPQRLDRLLRYLTAPHATVWFDLPWVPLYLAATFLFHPVIGWAALTGLAAICALSWLGTKLHRAAGPTAAARHKPALKAQHADGRIAERRATYRAADIDGATQSGLRALRLFLQSALLATGAALVLRDELSPGAMIAATILFGRITAPVDLALAGASACAQARRDFAALRNALQHRPAPVWPGNLLKVQNLSLMSSTKDSFLLRDITLTLKSGEVLGILGAGGSGKSCLTACLAGLHPPSTGQIANGLGTPLLWQEREGFTPGTIAQNLTGFDPEPDTARLFAMLEQVGLSERITRLPLGLNTEVAANGAPFSTTELEALKLARLLCGRARLWLLDPGALEVGLRNRTLTALAEHKAQGGAALILSRAPELLTGCDRVLILQAGRLSELQAENTLLSQRQTHVRPASIQDIA